MNAEPDTTHSPRPSFAAELLDAIAGRTFFLVLGVLLIQLAFVASYVGAFHHPTPHRIPILVSAPGRTANSLAARLEGLPGAPLQASPASDRTAALARLRNGSTSGVLVVSASGSTDTLYVAGGGGAALVTALEDVIGSAEAAPHRTVHFVDAVPAQAGDARGLSGFYLVIGWLIGGYLAASLLALSHGARPANGRRALIRLIAMLIYGVVSGLTGALIVGPVIGALTGHLLALWAIGTLLVFAAAAVTMAFQVIAGVLGIGITVILFVVLGNPSAGGAYPAPLLPGFWRAISPYIPNGAGVQAVRRVVYFGANGISGDLLLVAAYAALGTVVTLAVARARSHDGEPQAGDPGPQLSLPDTAPAA